MELNANVRSFYIISATSLFFMWFVFTVFGKEDFHRRIGRAVLAIRPTLVPAKALAFLLKTPNRFLGLCHAIVAVNIVAALLPDVWLARLLAAIVFSLYHCVEYVILH